MYKYCTKFCKINILNVFLLNLHDEIKNLPTLVMHKINLLSKIISLAVQTNFCFPQPVFFPKPDLIAPEIR